MAEQLMSSWCSAGGRDHIEAGRSGGGVCVFKAEMEV